MIDYSKRSGVLAAGNFLVDQVKTIDAWPDQDALVNILSLQQSNGGGPYNLLIDLARLGVDYPLAALGRIGSDHLGSCIRDDLGKHGVDCRQLLETGTEATSYTDVMTVRDTGRRTFFHMRGANALLDVDDFALANTRYRIFYLGYLMLLDRLDQIIRPGETGFATVLKRAREAGMSTIADAVSTNDVRFPEVVAAALPFLDTLVLNEWEAGQVTRRELTRQGRIDLSEVDHAARDLLSAAELQLVIIHFPTGAYARHKDGPDLYQPAVNLPAPLIKGTVGAGDAFCAGIVHALHEGHQFDVMLQSAVCIAAASLLSPTASDGILSLPKCLDLGREFGFRES